MQTRNKSLTGTGKEAATTPAQSADARDKASSGGSENSESGEKVVTKQESDPKPVTSKCKRPGIHHFWSRVHQVCYTARYKAEWRCPTCSQLNWSDPLGLSHACPRVICL